MITPLCRMLPAAMLCLLVLCCSCGQEISSKKELAAYVSNPKHQLQVSHDIGEIQTSLAYKPWQLMRSDRKKDKRDAKTTVPGTISGQYFFVLSLSAHHKELLRQLSYSDYSEMVQVMAFRMMDYVSAVTDRGKTVAPQSCLFEQTYGLGTANQLLISFDRSAFEGSGKVSIVIREFGLHTGNLYYQFNLNDINALKNIVLTN